MTIILEVWMPTVSSLYGGQGTWELVFGVSFQAAVFGEYVMNIPNQQGVDILDAVHPGCPRHCMYFVNCSYMPDKVMTTTL